MVTENERNAIIAECAEAIDKEASEWNTVFFDFLENEHEDGMNYAMTRAMTLQDAAEIIRMLSPDYKEKRNQESEKIKKWTKSIIANNPIDMPNIKDN